MMQGCASTMMGNGTVTLSEGLAQLKCEHIPLLEKLHGLFDICSKIDKNEAVKENFAQLEPAVSTFIAELEPHSEREERILFRMMERYLGVGMGPIAVMEHEHTQAKLLIGRFFEKTAEKRDHLSLDEMKECSDFIKNAYFTLTDHFSKEENVLFPMAENMLSDEEKAELAEKIKQI
ncbi:hemerythrin domain-containing protein [Bacillus marasmi]|uniref:hemerythrin domain-containing protein n=1 Tax=Bacillus marasmi TaxID=1926279 RepID=UPI001FE2CD1F|nr:hemerythrin domain-containing protein [Bacillus marasmi]